MCTLVPNACLHLDAAISTGSVQKFDSSSMLLIRGWNLRSCMHTHPDTLMPHHWGGAHNLVNRKERRNELLFKRARPAYMYKFCIIQTIQRTSYGHQVWIVEAGRENECVGWLCTYLTRSNGFSRCCLVSANI